MLTLKKDMKVVMDSYFKRSNFISGLADQIKKESRRVNTNEYIKDFAIEVNADLNQLRSFSDRGDWNGFVQYLTDL